MDEDSYPPKIHDAPPEIRLPGNTTFLGITQSPYTPPFQVGVFEKNGTQMMIPLCGLIDDKDQVVPLEMWMLGSQK